MKRIEIIVEVDEKGQMTMKAEGFAGDACLKEIQALMKGTNLAGATIARSNDGDENQGQGRTIKINPQL